MTGNNVFDINAAKIVELHKVLPSAFRDRDAGPEEWRAWQEAARQFRETYDDLAFPGGLTRQQQRLKQQDAAAVESAVQFLEADPWFFRSGYIKGSFIRVLRRIPLSDDHQSRLRQVVLAKVDRGVGREFRQYCMLARAVQSVAFRADLEARLHSSDNRVSQRALWMLEALR